MKQHLVRFDVQLNLSCSVSDALHRRQHGDNGRSFAAHYGVTYWVSFWQTGLTSVVVTLFWPLWSYREGLVRTVIAEQLLTMLRRRLYEEHCLLLTQITVNPQRKSTLFDTLSCLVLEQPSRMFPTKGVHLTPWPPASSVRNDAPLAHDALSAPWPYTLFVSNEMTPGSFSVPSPMFRPPACFE